VNRQVKGDPAVPPPVGESIDALPVIAEALERCLAAYRASYQQAMVASGWWDGQRGDEDLCDQLVDGSGAGDLGEMLEEVACRLCRALGIDVPKGYPRRSQEEAAATLRSIAAWYGPQGASPPRARTTTANPATSWAT